MAFSGIMSILSEFLSFPCAACRGRMPDGAAGLCRHCLAQIPFAEPPFCAACGSVNDGIFELCSKCLKEEGRPWKNALSLMRMEGTARELIHRFKYRGDAALARPFASLAASRWRSSGFSADMIVPVPLHWTRSFTRGYNQSELFASLFSKDTGIPVHNAVRRIKRTPKQANLDRRQRMKNLKGAFSAVKREFFRNKSILLADDVMTTGSTLAEVSSVLLDAGASEVTVLILARG